MKTNRSVKANDDRHLIDPGEANRDGLAALAITLVTVALIIFLITRIV